MIPRAQSAHGIRSTYIVIVKELPAAVLRILPLVAPYEPELELVLNESQL